MYTDSMYDFYYFKFGSIDQSLVYIFYFIFSISTVYVYELKYV